VIGRRALLRLGGAAAALALAPGPGRGQIPATMSTRPIPRTGEALPAVGLGTWQTFDAGSGEAERAPLREVLRAFLAAGGRVIDSSPMYGRAEAVVGALLAEVPGGERAWLATKVWTQGKAEGEAQIRESMRRMRARRLDLLQVHNLLDVETHLSTLRDLKQSGTIRYVGITHHARSSFGAMERLLRAEALDFVQLPYSAATREAEARLLPAARETGTAVLVMRPFEEGALFSRVRGKPLPAFAAELGCTAWSQLFLKFILAHPAVTAVIPATSRPRHLAENVAAGSGPLPDAAQRRWIAEAVE
jgi:aryl-alcohol dehydrogenase-like predicted oxidoreductase